MSIGLLIIGFIYLFISLVLGISISIHPPKGNVIKDYCLLIVILFGGGLALTTAGLIVLLFFD